MRLNFTKSFLLVSTFAVALLGCRKEIAPNPPLYPSNFGSFDDALEPVDNFIEITLIQYLNSFSKDSAYSYDFSGKFTKNGSIQHAGTLKINDITIPFKSDGFYDLSESDTTHDFVNTVGRLPGSNLSVSVSGNNNVRGFSTSIYLPKKIIPEQFTNTYYNGGDVKLDWVADTTSFGKMSIQLNRVTSEKSVALDEVFYLVPDNGSITIPASAFSTWPADSHYKINLRKVSQVKYVDPVDGRVTWIFVLMLSDGL